MVTARRGQEEHRDRWTKSTNKEKLSATFLSTGPGEPDLVSRRISGTRRLALALRLASHSAAMRLE